MYRPSERLNNSRPSAGNSSADAHRPGRPLAPACQYGCGRSCCTARFYPHRARRQGRPPHCLTACGSAPHAPSRFWRPPQTGRLSAQRIFQSVQGKSETGHTFMDSAASGSGSDCYGCGRDVLRGN